MARLPLLLCLVSTHLWTTRPRGRDHVIPPFPPGKERSVPGLTSAPVSRVGTRSRGSVRPRRSPRNRPKLPMERCSFARACSPSMSNAFVFEQACTCTRACLRGLHVLLVTNGCSSLFHGIAPSCSPLHANRVVSCCIFVLCPSSSW